MFSFLFGKKVQTDDATTSVNTALDEAVAEAISSLGLLSRSAQGALKDAMLSMQNEGSKAVGSHLRKLEPQVDDTEREALGLGKRAFFSKQMVSCLTETGREDPINAIDATVVRATGSFVRAKKLIEGKERGNRWVEVRSYQSGDCMHCGKFEGRFLPIESVSALPPDNCDRTNCRFSFQTLSDFLKKHKEKKQ